MVPTHPQAVPPTPPDHDVGNTPDIDASDNKGTQKFNLNQVIHNYQGMDKDQLKEVLEKILPDLLQHRLEL